MSEKLKLEPCPKCGTDGAPLRRIGEMDEYRVECVECYTVKTPWFKTLGEAEAYWNAFAEGMNQQTARIAELEKENREQLIDYENRLCEARKYQQDAVKRCEELEAENKLAWQSEAKMTAECVRLRKALEEIKHVQRRKDGGMYDSDGDWYANECSSCRRMHEIAEKALKGAENDQ